MALALAWGVGPALPAVLRGELLGHPYTDLYPSVWGLWWFSSHQPGFPLHTDLLGFPQGMGLYFSSPIHGWLAWPLLPLLGLTATWNLLVVGARVGTVLAAWWAGRCWGLRGPGALAAAAVFACAPFFQGYAVEGIVEGTDGWALALLAATLGLRRPLWAAVALALTLLSSWYLGMAGCLLVVLATLRDRRAPLALLGLLAVLPAAVAFIHAFPAAAPLPDEVRRAMGAHLDLPRPAVLDGLQPFAMNAYLGWVVVAAAAWSRSPWVLVAAIPAVLSLGWGPWYHLPVLEQVRFPYRWHAATLALLAPAVGLAADRLRAWWLAPLIAAEGLLLGPAEPVIPGASAEVPPIYREVDGPVLVVPGPWSEKDLDFQARNVASMVANNGSFNCNAAKVIVMSERWPQRAAFLELIEHHLAQTPPRAAYYPGAQARYDGFLSHYPDAKPLGPRSSGVVPWTLIPNVTPEKGEHALTSEAFCGVVAETRLDATNPRDFLAEMVEFANESCWGTLSCVILIHPTTARQYAAELDAAIAGLRYGGIAINAFGGLIYALASPTWGAFPGHTDEDIQSGRGVVHNTNLIDHPQKSVLRAPFRMSPTPAWFADHKTAHVMGPALADFEAKPGLIRLPRVIMGAMRG